MGRPKGGFHSSSCTLKAIALEGKIAATVSPIAVSFRTHWTGANPDRLDLAKIPGSGLKKIYHPGQNDCKINP